MADFQELFEDGESASQRIADALRDAREGTTFDAKIKALTVAMHILVDPVRPNHLLDNFLDEMLEFAELREARILCLVIDFLQKASSKDHSVCPKAIERLSCYLNNDDSIPKYFRVIKRVIVACTNMYPVILEWVIKQTHAEAERCWESFGLLKGRILAHLDSDNDGVRTVAIKFMEALVLCQSPKPKEEPGSSNTPALSNEQNTRFSKISLNDVPRGHRFISYRKSQMESEQSFEALIKQTSVMHISAQNLLAVVEAMCMIARCRPTWDGALSRVIDAIEILYVNLPPTLGTSQVKSVRKELKRNLLRFLKVPASIPLQNKISKQLIYLGATQNEINRAIPQHLVQKPQKPKPVPEQTPVPAKRPKIDASIPAALFVDEDDDDEPTSSTSATTSSRREKDATTTAVDITAQYVFERLTPQVTTNLVHISILTLPDEMPHWFHSSYTPIAAAGTEEQRRDVSRMIATQATQLGFGPGFEQMREIKREEFQERQDARQEGIAIPPTPQIALNTTTGGTRRKPPQVAPGALAPPTAAPVLKTKKAFNLIEETKQMSKEDMEELFEIAFNSVLRAERRVVQGGATMMYQQLVVRLASRYREDNAVFEQRLRDFIVEEHKRRTELALLWICELYAQYQGYSYCAHWLREQLEGVEGVTKDVRFERYERVVCMLLESLMEKNLHKEALFHKILLESPLITPKALEWLKMCCLDKVYGAFGMTTLRELILTRNRHRTDLLQFLFGLCFHDKPELRISCVDTAKELCALPHLRRSLTEYAVEQLHECLEPQPPAHFNPETPSDKWTEEIFRCALAIYLGILPYDSSLLLPLSSVYASGETYFKRVVLRSIEPAVKAIGMRDEQMLRLVEECPPGAETLVARIVHLLTERAPAIPELVVRVKRLHDERRTDTRALIPIIGGLSRDEVIALIPQFVLRQEYQKSVGLVFRRLYNARDLTTGEASFSVIDLIVQYHLIQPENENEMQMHIANIEQVFDVRYVNKDTASQAVERLFEMRPLPYLFLYTLVCIHEKYTALESFLTTLMYKVAARELWKADEKTKLAFYHSVANLKTIAYGAVLTSLSFAEFSELIETNEEILQDLKDFFPTLSTSQQKSVDADIKEIVYDKEKEEEKRRERKEERNRERERDRERDKDREKRYKRRDAR